MGAPLLATRTYAALLFSLGIACCDGCRDRRVTNASAPPTTRPAAFAADVAEDLDRVVEDAMKRGDVPGAVLVVGRSGGVIYQKAYGDRAVAPTAEPMTLDTV